ncbi:MAG: ABC transporter substrate-binding protein [Puniceicoccales bacterium]|jgi:iron complex transport system substrate-binding protein|nr:ABC transporter substrate-binding protein [Puniceicoccales bacterium]
MIALARHLASLATLALAAATFLPATTGATAPTQAPTPTKKERLIVMGGPITEIVFALGASESIVGSDRTSLYPAEAQKLPSVGVYRALSVEGVLSLNPTKIISGSGIGPPAAVKQLKASGIPLLIVMNPRSEKTLFDAIDTLGKEISREKEARELTKIIQGRFAEVRQLMKGRPTPRVVFLMGMGGTASAAGSETQADGIITLAGGKNIFTEFRGYKPVSEEAILKADPDLILIASHSKDGDVAAPADPAKFLKRFGFKSIGTGGRAKIVPLDVGEFLIIGPRAGDTSLKLARIFYPEKQ